MIDRDIWIALPVVQMQMKWRNIYLESVLCRLNVRIHDMINFYTHMLSRQPSLLMFWLVAVETRVFEHRIWNSQCSS